MQVSYQVLRVLADGAFHSGQKLALQCQVSRARIWQAVELLRDYGLEIHAVRGRGYSLLDPIELLATDDIWSILSPESLKQISKIEILNQTDSTNDYLLRSIAHIQPNHLCLAECQVKGRGRRGKGWYSPLTKNIAMSYYTQVNVSPNSLPSLSLIVGISVINAIVQVVKEIPGLGIKWPNDIWFNNAKLCGILIDVENTIKQPGVTGIVIGIGLNTHAIDIKLDDNEVTSIEKVTGKIVSRNYLIGCIMNELIIQLSLFEQLGLSAFSKVWSKYDLLLGKCVQVKDAKSAPRIGICSGINETGALMIKHDEEMKAYLSADIQVRPYGTIS